MSLIKTITKRDKRQLLIFLWTQRDLTVPEYPLSHPENKSRYAIIILPLRGFSCIDSLSTLSHYWKSLRQSNHTGKNIIQVKTLVLIFLESEAHGNFQRLKIFSEWYVCVRLKRVYRLVFLSSKSIHANTFSEGLPGHISNKEASAFHLSPSSSPDTSDIQVLSGNYIPGLNKSCITMDILNDSKLLDRILWSTCNEERNDWCIS